VYSTVLLCTTSIRPSVCPFLTRKPNWRQGKIATAYLHEGPP